MARTIERASAALDRLRVPRPASRVRRAVPSLRSAAPPARPLLAGTLAMLAALAPAVVIAKSVLPVPESPSVPFVGTSPPSCHRRTLDADSAARRGPVAFAQLPGRVLSTTDRVAIYNTATFRTKGSFEMVDVHLDAVTNWLGLDLVRRDCRADLFNRVEILGDGSVQQVKEDDRKLMSASQDLAIYVALHRLGIPVAVRDGGIVIDSFCADDADGTCTRAAPAAKLLRAGDVITAVDGKAVQLAPDLAPILASHAASDLVTVDITRGKTKLVALVPLAADGAGHASLGVTPSSLLPSTTTFNYPFEVAIDVGGTGGPSAGLAFALTLIDQLSKGELTGAKRVAATGEITATGRVGPIGGIRQKTIAVRNAGASVFLVPKSQAAEAARAAQGSELKVFGVATLDDALKTLVTLGGDPLPSAAPDASH